MSDILEARWQISDQAIVNPVADEVVILHLGNGTYYGLNPIGARLWDALRAGDPPITICAAVLQEYEIDAETLASDLRALLNDLTNNDLITPA